MYHAWINHQPNSKSKIGWLPSNYCLLLLVVLVVTVVLLVLVAPQLFGNNSINTVSDTNSCPGTQIVADTWVLINNLSETSFVQNSAHK